MLSYQFFETKKLVTKHRNLNLFSWIHLRDGHQIVSTKYFKDYNTKSKCISNTLKNVKLT
jgi:hypothetical protein